ncbi:MAG TPA: SPFH domain-containing protein [Planctomycetota bacterium]|nr:SPFH domain-containing protein [Planctomycetota bacterium]
MNNKTMLKSVAVLAAIVAVFYVGVWQWLICRVYVRPGEILVVQAKFGDENKDPDANRVVPRGTKGVWKDVFGEGRYFFSPIEFQVETQARGLDVGPEQVGLVESMSGASLEAGEFLAKEGQKGLLAQVLTPGRWRLNPVANKVKLEPATVIRPGSVGCVTKLSGPQAPDGQLSEPHQRGIQKNVLQPGLYYLNPREYKVDEIWVGYSEITLENVQFPSKDGFIIQLDISVVWGLLPKDVPVIMNRFGDTKAVVDKIIRPQIESICRIEGSKYGAKDFIEGTSREKFQTTFTDQLVSEAKIRNIDVIIGLVRDIHVPLELRAPIQNAKIAAEEQLTKEEQRKTQVIQNELEELKAEVDKGVREVAAETDKMVAEARATGERKEATIRGEREVVVAEVQRRVAELAAERERILGKAEADVIELAQKAEADRFQKNVQALGNPEAYADYIFATKLSDDLKIVMRYAGPGTFWTDLPGGLKSIEDAAARTILQKENQKK